MGLGKLKHNMRHSTMIADNEEVGYEEFETLEELDPYTELKEDIRQDMHDGCESRTIGGVTACPLSESKPMKMTKDGHIDRRSTTSAKNLETARRKKAAKRQALESACKDVCVRDVKMDVASPKEAVESTDCLRRRWRQGFNSYKRRGEDTSREQIETNREITYNISTSNTSKDLSPEVSVSWWSNLTGWIRPDTSPVVSPHQYVWWATIYFHITPQDLTETELECLKDLYDRCELDSGRGGKAVEEINHMEGTFIGLSRMHNKPVCLLIVLFIQKILKNIPSQQFFSPKLNGCLRQQAI